MNCKICGSALCCVIGAYYECPNGCDTLKQHRNKETSHYFSYKEQEENLILYDKTRNILTLALDYHNHHNNFGRAVFKYDKEGYNSDFNQYKFYFYATFFRYNKDVYACVFTEQEIESILNLKENVAETIGDITFCNRYNGLKMIDTEDQQIILDVKATRSLMKMLRDGMRL